MIRVEAVSGRGGIGEFIRAAPPLYRGVSAWVRPLDVELRFRLGPRKDPFWRHAEGALLVARRGTAAVGRLLVSHDRLRSEHTGEGTATFGLFEAEDDPGIALALFGAAEAWARERGLESLLGPFCLSIHDQVGLLVEGFHLPPRILMPYGREYYPALLEHAGLRPVREFLAYEWDVQAQRAFDPGPLPPGTRLRTFDRSRRREETAGFLEVYNEAFAENWGFVPMTPAEADSAVGDFLRYADLRLPRLAEVDGEPAGFLLLLPDLNEALRDADGKLFPLGLLRILLRRRSVRNVRVMTAAVRPRFRPGALALHLIHAIWQAGRAAGYRTAEFGYVDTQNRTMRRIVERIGARPVKRYRLYGRSL